MDFLFSIFLIKRKIYYLSLLVAAWNIPLDAITFSFILWNFSVVGIIAIFWHGPTKINQVIIL